MSTQKHLLPQGMPYHKACLHTHSVISDGNLTPEELKKAYQAEGYHILALTDHSVTIDHQYLNEPGFLMITGTEIDITDQSAPVGPRRTCHMCLLSRDPHLQWIPFRDNDVRPHMLAYLDRCQSEDMVAVYSPESINAVIAKANEKGFLVTYNHPVWSMETYPQYMALRGLWGMEYRNSTCIAAGYDENNGFVYQNMLEVNPRLMPVMADDTHNPVRKNGAKCLGASWIMVASPTLEYDAVMDALERGDLYASCGPTIETVVWEENCLRVRCSPAARVQVVSHTRFAQLVLGENNQSLTEVEFDMTRWVKYTHGNPDATFRVIITDAQGNYAVTRAYRLAEL